MIFLTKSLVTDETQNMNQSPSNMVSYNSNYFSTRKQSQPNTPVVTIFVEGASIKCQQKYKNKKPNQNIKA